MRIDPLLRALADENRLRIMRLLAHMELAVGELAQVLGQSQPRVSRHVRILCDAGLAERRKEGSWVFVRSAIGEHRAPPLGAAAARLLLAAEQDDAGFSARCAEDRRHLAAIRSARESTAQSYFARHAGEWDTLRSLHAADGPVEAALLRCLGGEPLGLLLDVGTGTGRIAQLLTPHAGHVTGFDKSPEMLRIARTRLQEFPAEQVELVQGDFNRLPFADAAFDTVLFHQVLHYAQEPGTVLAEAARVTKAGGRIAIVDFAAHDREELRSAHAHARLGFSDEQMLGILTDAGYAAEAPLALPGRPLTVKIWTARRTAGVGPGGDHTLSSPTKGGHPMTSGPDARHEYQTAHDTPLFASLPGDIRVSFEFFPPKTEKMDEQLWDAITQLEPLSPSFVSVTYGAGGSTRERTHATVARIVRETSLVPAAHLTCVAASKAEIAEIADQYWEAGVRHIVALRGDPPPADGGRFVPHPQGYASAAELVAGLRARHDFEISVAAYPEVHPDAVSAGADLDNLKRKLDAGASRAITQFFYSTDAWFRFLDKVHAAGITAPILPGIMPVTNFAAIRRMSANTEIPAWMEAMFEGLDERPGPRALVAATVAAEFCRRLYAGGVRDFHFYTLNRAEQAYAICHLLGLRAKES